MINDKGNMEDQINEIRGKAEAAFQTILTIAGDHKLRGIQMKTIWKLVETCIKPIITYAAETWNPTKTEMKKLNAILDNIIKRILQTPTTTPRENLYIETGILDIEHTMERNKLLMRTRLKVTKNDLITKILKIQTKKSWSLNVNEIAKQYDIERVEHLETPVAKRIINSKTRIRNLLDMMEKANSKSKVAHLTTHRDKTNITKVPSYINILTRRETSWIFKARSRMLEVKNNFRGMHSNLTCRGCGKTDETQIHVMTECECLHENNSTKVEIDELFDETAGINELQNTANKIKKIMERLKKSDAPPTQGRERLADAGICSTEID